MNQTPHFLLFAEARPQPDRRRGERGRWRFLLESMTGTQRLEASDVEYGVRGERLELLALVRGLEALDQPSRVTLFTASDPIRRGLRYGLEDWRRNAWMWERFGKLVPVKNRDLWQRVDRAARIHRVECRLFRLDPGHAVRQTGSTGRGTRWYHRRFRGWLRRAGRYWSNRGRNGWLQSLRIGIGQLFPRTSREMRAES
jgi:ribonuclease HI